MQRCSHSLSTASALRSIFFPTTNQTCVSTFLAPSYAPDAPPRSFQQQHRLSSNQTYYRAPSRSFTPANAPPSFSDDQPGATRHGRRPVSAAAAELRKFGAQKDRRPKDDEIEARTVLLAGGLSGTEPGQAVVSTASVLGSLDRTTHCLVQVGQTEGMPACRVMTRQQYFEYEQKRGKVAAAAKKKSGKPAKQLELSWGIDTNDLEHRLNKAAEFLNSGKKVEIILAPKKKGKSTSPEDSAKLVRNIKDRIAQMGHKESKPMEGKIGAMATLFFESKT